MKTIVSFIIIPVILLIVASCQEDVPTAPIKSGSVKNFPNTLGSTWVYLVVDNLKPPDPLKPGDNDDTVVVTIDRYATDSVLGLSGTVWTYLYNQSPIPEKLVVFKEDTVYFYWNYTSGDKIGLVFPFDFRDTWKTGGFLSGDKTTVIDTTAMRVPVGLFPKVYVLKNEKRTSISTDTRIMTIWFVPDLGIIRLNLHEEHALSVGDTTWTLAQHNNPNF